MITWLVTPSFCKAQLLEDCLVHLNSDRAFGEIPNLEHIIIDNHYPINKAVNRDRIRCLAKEYGCILIDSRKDLGLHEGINNALKQLPIDYEKDCYLGSDPDDRPEPGIFKAMVEVMNMDLQMAVLSGIFWVIDQRIKEGVPFKEEVIAAHNVLIHPSVEMFNVAAFNLKFIHSIGGFKQTYSHYGGIEAALYHEWIKRGMHMGYLKDYWTESRGIIVDRNDTTRFDPEYRQWKDDHIAHKFQGSFEKWLRHNNKGNLIHG